MKNKTTKLITMRCFITTLILGLFITSSISADDHKELKNCESCHAEQTSEYEASVHYINRSGVQAACNDCHKFQSHKMGGKTPKEVTKPRIEMAMSEWARMKESDSKACKGCHTHMAMDLAKQEPRSVARHEESFHDGETSCINCHKGISHKLPSGWKAKAQKAGLQK